MTEPIEPVPLVQPVAPALPVAPAVPVAASEPGIDPVVPPGPTPEYGVYAPPVPEPVPGDPLRGLLAGLGVALVGALVWALVVYATNYEIGFVALFIGYGVGYAVHRVGGVATSSTAIAAAVLAAGGILLGFVLTAVAIVAKVAQVGFLDAVNLTTDRIGWGRLLTTAISGLDWAFLAIGAFAAFRLVAQQRRTGRRA